MQTESPLPADDRDAFFELALRYLDGVTSPAENESLQAQLAASFERRELFVALCHQQTALSEIAVDPSRDDTAPAKLRAPTSASRSPNWPTLLVALSIAALAVIGTFLMWPGSIPPAVAHAGFDPYLAPQYIATLTSADGCRWKAGELPTFSGARLVAGRLSLESGQAEVKFDSGALVVMRGPAELQLQSDMGGQLLAGQLVVHAPPRAKGFSIQTAAGTIVDLGTSFGVVADGKESVEVHVLEGLVELESPSSRGMENMRREPVPAGQARRGDAEQTWISAPFDAAQFAATTSAMERSMPASLVSYWNFDEEGGPLPDLRGTNDGQLKGSAARVAGLIGRGAVEFHNNLTDRVLVGPGGDSLHFTGGITVEAIFVSRWDGKFGNYDEIFRKEDGDRRILLAFQNDNYPGYSYPKFTRGPVLAFGLHVGGRYSELDMPLDGQEGRPTVAEFADGKMHQVAATYDAATGLKAIYLDGKLRDSTQLTGSIASGGPAVAVIGNLESSREPFDGMIDEVAIYREALDAATIAKHWERVQAGKSYFDE